jgi:steroid delta-isomerase-like uncharacterized protein
MSTKDPKAFMRHIFEERNKGKAAAMAVVDETNVFNVVVHGGSGREYHGLKDLKQYFSEFYDAFPDVHFTLDDMVVEGDKVVKRYTMTGTHKGEFMGIPATNKKITLWGIEIDRIAGGKIVESWARYDTLGMMQQLGAIPMPKK